VRHPIDLSTLCLLSLRDAKNGSVDGDLQSFLGQKEFLPLFFSLSAKLFLASFKVNFELFSLNSLRFVLKQLSLILKKTFLKISL